MNYMVAYTYREYDKWSNPPIVTQRFENAFFSAPRTLKEILKTLETSNQTNPPTRMDFAILNIIADNDSNGEVTK